MIGIKELLSPAQQRAQHARALPAISTLSTTATTNTSLFFEGPFTVPLSPPLKSVSVLPSIKRERSPDSVYCATGTSDTSSDTASAEEKKTMDPNGERQVDGKRGVCGVKKMSHTVVSSCSSSS